MVRTLWKLIFLCSSPWKISDFKSSFCPVKRYISCLDFSSSIWKTDELLWWWGVRCLPVCPSTIHKNSCSSQSGQILVRLAHIDRLMGLQPRCSSSVCSCVTVGGPPGLLSGFKLSVICDEQLTNGKNIYSAFRCFFSFFLVDGYILCYIYYYILWNYFKLMDQWYILFINAKWVLIYKYLKNRFVSLPEGEPLQSCLFCFLFLCFFFGVFLVGGVSERFCCSWCLTPALW